MSAWVLNQRGPAVHESLLTVQASIINRLPDSIIRFNASYSYTTVTHPAAFHRHW